MKLYSFNPSASALVPSTPTVVSFVRAMLKMKKQNNEVFTGLDVMKFALENGLWTTKQITEKQLMTTWAFYLKTLKEIGVTECGNVGGSKKVIAISDLLEIDDETGEIEWNEEETEEAKLSEDEQIQKMIDEENASE